MDKDLKNFLLSIGFFLAALWPPFAAWEWLSPPTNAWWYVPLILTLAAWGGFCGMCAIGAFVLAMKKA